MDLKPRFKPPSRPDSPPPGLLASQVHIRHPAYPDAAPALLRLKPLDVAKDGRHGLDYDTALVACCIVANNAFATGWLATRAGCGFRLVQRPADNLLHGTEYFFCVGDKNPRRHVYPVVPSFDHWRFPHDALPSPWKDLRIEDQAPKGVEQPAFTVDNRDRTCRVTGYSSGLEASHLVPAADEYWFQSNGMGRYCRDQDAAQGITDDRNMLLLRADLHQLLDARRFTFAAKYVMLKPEPAPREPRARVARRELLLPVSTHVSVSPPPTPLEAVLTLHVFLPHLSGELVRLYHNRHLQPIRGLAPEFLFARFARSIFTDPVYPFFDTVARFTVALWNNDEMRQDQETLETLELRRRMELFSPYAMSPKKRSRPSTAVGALPQEPILGRGDGAPGRSID
ncbi:hypothetical protein MAPG_10552 [Magnaporthiopsis poae ATCC 64411]|uniref:HNH nuclease domain-containing protein n=1 Tax=Magnaporthiopsis poae (strain ATCC 64411 / 73-15) TaxID=644358 RepID=A0A0C4ECW3_MAGP6|nr:hypothetical protein MAPG_10552 [Magnaporthiopsis poae ATCC 64411]